MTASTALGLLAALALAAARHRAAPDPLADLQAALARLEASTPVTARFTVRYENVTGEGKDAVQVAGEVSGEAAEGADGLQIRWGRAVLRQVREEERRHGANPEVPTPTRDGLVAGAGHRPGPPARRGRDAPRRAVARHPDRGAGGPARRRRRSGCWC